MWESEKITQSATTKDYDNFPHVEPVPSRQYKYRYTPVILNFDATVGNQALLFTQSLPYTPIIIIDRP